jgi:transcriptional regulator with XRE-family HTH domain
MSQGTSIGANILNYRKIQDLSQQQLADYLGITRELISLIETGKREISIANLNKLADLFGIELEELLEEDQSLKEANVAFAFRSNNRSDNNADLSNIAAFQRIVLNYLKMEKLKDELQAQERSY